MKHVKISDSDVFIPKHRLFKFFYEDFSFNILADNMVSAVGVLTHYFGEAPYSIREVSKANSSYLFLLCDSYLHGKKFVSLCRVPLRDTLLCVDGIDYRSCIVSYFRFNISPLVNVVFE